MLKFDTIAMQIRVDRARTALGKGISYKLGKGGVDPKAKLPTSNKECDCSGFISWVIGLNRDQTKTLGFWISTSDIAFDADHRHKLFVRTENPEIGGFVVYPDHDGHQGHVALITGIHGDLTILDCSMGHHGIAEHPDTVFKHTSSSLYCVLLSDRTEV